MDVLLILIAIVFIAIMLQLSSSWRSSGALRSRAITTKIGSAQGFTPPSISQTHSLLERAPDLDKIIKSADTLLYLDQIPHAMPYQRSKDVIKTNVHNGQLKLFLTELEFLTDSLDKDTPAIVVYAGSAPSNKIYFLAKMFPRVKFVLVDPNEHYIMFSGGSQYDDKWINKCLYFRAREKTKFAPTTARINAWLGGAQVTPRRGIVQQTIPTNILDIIRETDYSFYIIEDYFTEEIGALLSGDCLFISDIRSREESADNPTDLDILWNSAMMYNWLKVLKPRRYMLKFRCPYVINDTSKRYLAIAYENSSYTHPALNTCDIKFMENFYQDKFVYLKPERIYLQSFAGQTSTETRLVGSTLELAEYNIVDYNDKLFYYNRVYRSYGWHHEVTPYIDDEIGIDHCGDCGVMCKIFARYFEKWDQPDKTKKYVRDLLHMIHRNIRDIGYHGHYRVQYKSAADMISTLQSQGALAVVKTALSMQNIKWRPINKKDVLARLYAVSMYKGQNPPAFRALLSIYGVLDPRTLNTVLNIETPDTKSETIQAWMSVGYALPLEPVTVRDNQLVCGNLAVPNIDIEGMTIEERFTEIGAAEMTTLEVDDKWIKNICSGVTEPIVTITHTRALKINVGKDATQVALTTHNIFEELKPGRFYVIFLQKIATTLRLFALKLIETHKLKCIFLNNHAAPWVQTIYTTNRAIKQLHTRDFNGWADRPMTVKIFGMSIPEDF